MTEFSSILNRFEPISLSEMEGVKLMNRIDTKFVLSRSQLPAILAAAQADYFVQDIDGVRLATYDTIYYDTDSWDMYIRHHDRQLVRQKIRVRQYVDSDLTFLEVKRKNNKGRTKKKRIAINGFNPSGETVGHNKKADISVADFVAEKSRYTWDAIAPHLRTAFHRITLVNRAKTERLTIDSDLVWTNLLNGARQTYADLVIVELKRDGNQSSPMLRIMDEAHVKPLKISKYCIGSALTTPDIKRNRFKAKIRKIEKLLKS